MQNVFRKLFAPPIFPEDEDKTRSAFILNALGWVVIGVLTILLMLRIFVPMAPERIRIVWIFVGMIFITGLILVLSHLGYVRAASFILTTMGWMGLSAFAWNAEGIRDVAVAGFFLPILMAGLLIGWRGALIFTAASILSSFFLVYAETNQVISPQFGTPANFAIQLSGVLVLACVLISLIINDLQKAAGKARLTAHELSLSNKELSHLQIDLEKRVDERTTQLEKRAAAFEAVSSVARAIASVQDLDTLLPAITKLISKQFDFYHVGVFLLDEKRERAVLRASNSEGGLRMLNREHSLPVDHHSIVGYSVVRGEPRVVLDVGADSVYFNNPDLPETRSEMALPLRVSDRVIGSLDVQSTQTNAFSEEDINVLTTLADQVAIAIENARLFGEAKDALRESRALFEKYSQQEWSTFARQVRQTGFVFDGKQITPLDGSAKREVTKAVAQTGSLSLEKESDSIGIPIRLRGQTIGVLDVRSKKGPRQWKQDEISILEAAAERAALALENARLVQSAQRRAARERAIGDISAKIGSVSTLESILQTAVEELGRKIGGATEVALEISNEDSQNDR